VVTGLDATAEVIQEERLYPAIQRAEPTRTAKNSLLIAGVDDKLDAGAPRS
jgi:hypothetical protein